MINATYKSLNPSPKLLTVDNPVLRIVFASVLILIGLVVAYLSTQDDIIFSTRISLVIGYLIGIPILLSSDYMRSIMMMFLFASVAGLLKYKTDFNPVIHVTLDIMMAVICFGWLIRRFYLQLNAPAKTHTPLGGLIGLFVTVCLLQLFNPYTFSYVASIAALKMHICMIPLFFFGYHYCRSIDQIRQWMIVFAIIGVLMSLVAISQFEKGPDQMKAEMPEYSGMIDSNTWQDDTGKSFFRPMSTTSNAGGASTWMQCIIPLTIAVCMSKIATKRLKAFLIGVLIICLLTLLISLIRQMFIVTAAGLGLMFLLQFKLQKIGKTLVVSIFVLAVAFSSYLLAGNVTGNSGIIRGFLDDVVNPVASFQNDNRSRMLNLIAQVAEVYPLGAGLGRTGPAAMKFAEENTKFQTEHGSVHWRSLMDKGVLVPGIMPGENYFLVMISETGIPGTLLITLITVLLLVKGFKAFKTLQDDGLRWYAAGILGVLFSIFVVFFGGPALVTTPLNLFFWFMGGVLLKLPVLDQALREHSEPPQFTSPEIHTVANV